MANSRLPWVLLVIVIGAWAWQALSPSFVTLRSRVVITDNATATRADVKNDSSISDHEKVAFEEAFRYDSAVQPYGKTVSEIISEEQKKLEDQSRANLAAAASAAIVTSELKNDIEIRPSAFSVKRGISGVGNYKFDNKYDDTDEIDFAVTNKGHKVIVAFAADANLTNEGGEKIYEGILGTEGRLAPGDKLLVHVDHKPTGYESDTARATSLNSLLVHYSVTKIRYSDGSEASI